VTRERLEVRVASLEEKARTTTGIATTTVELLETHRAELESFDPSEIDPLLFVTDGILATDY
jgi:hypothetical protein